MEELRGCLLRHWVHSHEEDTQEVRVYRPTSYNFPPSRGRMGLEFREGGELVYHAIARADGSEQSYGRWAIEGSNRLRIDVDSEQIQPFTLEVVSCDQEILTVRR